MNILVFGAGAIGSLFGALLSKNNTVVLIGRTAHATMIKKHGLKITGKTNITVHTPAETTVENIACPPDLVMITVKAYDTKAAIKTVQKLITKNTMVMSLQNGLDNIDTIEKTIDRKHIIAGVTSHGALFTRPGWVEHTGKGYTVLGELDGAQTQRLQRLVSLFNEAGIETQLSTTILNELWAKGIINSSINPLTTFFTCKNGYLLENPILEHVVELVCHESTTVAQATSTPVSYQEMLRKTKQVIRMTADNDSSMLQSMKKKKKTEIDSINGNIVTLAKKYSVEVPLNEILLDLIKNMS